MVSPRIAVAAARGLVRAVVEFGGHIELDTSRAYSLLNRMEFVKRKVTTTKSKISVEKLPR